MTARGSKLARAVRIYVSFGWWFCAVGLVVVPLGLLLVLGRVSQPDLPAPDMPVLARIQVDEAALARVDAPAADQPSTLVFGQGEMRIRTRSRSAWTLLFLVIEIVLVVLLYVYGQLRSLMRSVVERDPFDARNATRIRHVGLVVIGWGIVSPFLKLVVGAAMIDEVAVRGLILSPAVELQLETVFFGLAILVLAEIFRQASEMKTEQSLTI